MATSQPNFSFKRTSITQDYKFLKRIAQGSCGMVIKARNIHTEELAAIKVLNKPSLTGDELNTIHNEINILNELQHGSIVRLNEVYQETSKLYLVFEYMAGGDLFDKVVEKEHFTEDEARVVMKSIAESINFFHAKNIVHRDIKPENILYMETGDCSRVKLSDFGVARYLTPAEISANTACGSPSYIAPEVLVGKGYSFEVDYWSLGIILYIMLCGFPPFAEDSNALLFEKIKKAEFAFPTPEFDNVSEEAKDLIKHILVAEPEKRLNGKQILSHPWMCLNRGEN